MDSNFYAVLIGFNKYKDSGNLPNLNFSEKDARDFYDMLIDPNYGNVPAKNIILVTGSEFHMHLDPNEIYSDKIRSLAEGTLPVDQLETDDIETILYTQVVKNRKPEDTVLVYYSGHGFIAGSEEKAFLATPDVSILNIQSNPKSGLQMEYLHDDIFMETKAKFIVFLLDCCTSGAFCSSLGRKEQSDYRRLVEKNYFTGEGRVAFVSSPSGFTSRESKDFRNGIFTHHLLNGLKGAAAEPSGDVSIASLVSYVTRLCPVSQQPIFYGNFSRIVLAKPKLLDETNKPIKVYRGGMVEPPSEFTNPILPLINPLNDHVRFISNICDCLRSIPPGEPGTVSTKILSSIRCSLDAEFVLILRIEEGEGEDKVEKNFIYKYQSDFEVKGCNQEEYTKRVLSNLYGAMIQRKKDLLIERYGFHKSFDGEKGSGKCLVAIPLRVDYPREYLILCGMDEEKLKYGEILGRALISLYDATQELTTLELSKIEMSLIDDLKRDFGFLPSKTYSHRLELFKNKLEQVVFYYEPIINLSKRRPEIYSWEALARDPETNRVPIDLFKAAELWGPQFITELDIYCLRNAITGYANLWDQEHPGRKTDPLSVNVYPETLFRSSYKNELMRILKDQDMIIGGGLTLEISEKHPLPRVDEMAEYFSSKYSPVEQFVKKMHEYTRQFQIGFAIDDFGVGDSSVERLAKLQLDHVKIDRDILLHLHPECTIEYVKKVVDETHTHPYTIIVEGFDWDSNITLKSLYDLGIHYVQGYKIREARPTVCDLSEKESEYIILEVSKTAPFGERPKQEQIL